eukprot:NODE_482_length_6938_cov_0.582541.p7 type:complete len:103 gc:universal NODE_482_length_6938_cov_0.582541:3497-3189(-)
MLFLLSISIFAIGGGRPTRESCEKKQGQWKDNHCIPHCMLTGNHDCGNSKENCEREGGTWDKNKEHCHGGNLGIPVNPCHGYWGDALKRCKLKQHRPKRHRN